MLVSHRLSAVRDADRIVVLADRQVCEEGTHEDLLQRPGRYDRLFNPELAQLVRSGIASG